MSRLIDLELDRDSIVIFDRRYYSAEIYEEWCTAECKVLMRLKRPNRLCELEGDDVVTCITMQDGTSVPCRVLKYALSTGETEYLITNVMDLSLTPDMFGELYFYRWKVETKYLEIKEHWKIEEFSGTGALAVRQDFYIIMLQSNLASFIKHQADAIIGRSTRSKNTYEYRARRTYIIGKVCRNFVSWIIEPLTQLHIDETIIDASKKRSQVRPGRSGKRKRQTRARKHYINRKTVV